MDKLKRIFKDHACVALNLYSDEEIIELAKDHLAMEEERFAEAKKRYDHKVSELVEALNEV